MRKAEIVKQYQISPICPDCNSDMVRDPSNDTGIKELAKALITNTTETPIMYAYRCISCGNIERSTHIYPCTQVFMDLEHAEYTPEEEYYK